MKYKIFELVTPEELADCVESFSKQTYYYTKSVLENIKLNEMKMEHDSMEQAINEIEKFKTQLGKTTLTIIPVITL